MLDQLNIFYRADIIVEKIIQFELKLNCPKMFMFNLLFAFSGSCRFV